MAETLTPMMQQYRRVKSKLPANTILFFRLGDFYEMFFEDAVEAAAILNITLTRRQKAPMCGVPYHAYETYLAKLIRAGKKVAICDQMEAPSRRGASKSIVRREITSVVTPGAVLSEQLLDSRRNNYLAGIYSEGNRCALALLDLSTGEFRVEEMDGMEELRDGLLRHAPAECVAPLQDGGGISKPLGALLESWFKGVLTPYEEWAFEYATARDTLTAHFGVQSLEGFGCEGRVAAVGAAGGILHYVKNTLRCPAANVRALRLGNPSDYLYMDEATRANLDLVARCAVPPTGGVSVAADRCTALLDVLDDTKTAMGGRLLRDWILRPLSNLDLIRRRHNAVAALCADRDLLRKMRAELVQVRDLERLMARLSAASGGAREMRALATSLLALKSVMALLASPPDPLLAELKTALNDLPELREEIERTIVDEPPTLMKDGGVIREGCNSELDSLRAAAGQARAWLAEYQTREQTRTGIKTLKVRFNDVFGYYIEVSKGQAENVPPDYTRKQTMVNAERFVTPELKEFEGRILGANERAVALEMQLLSGLRAAIMRSSGPILASAAAVAALDALASLADRALAFRYVRPDVNGGNAIRIKDGRHPVIEQLCDSERFVPNDTLIDSGENRLIVLTGPNMAGKSTYIRQVALIVIMAQAGSFVPASSAEIGLVDRIFTRVGASDDLVRGRSTFMVEMQETANILNNATARSLIILDEIGRGTSTFDGISLAWAVAEFLHDKIGAKSLFATHYHELTDLVLSKPGVKNFNVLVRESLDRIVFLRKIVPGAADKSYGIHVARLAGLPGEVIERAGEILENLEEGEFESGQPKLAVRRQRKSRNDSSQLMLFRPEGVQAPARNGTAALPGNAPTSYNPK